MAGQRVGGGGGMRSSGSEKGRQRESWLDRDGGEGGEGGGWYV